MIDGVDPMPAPDGAADEFTTIFVPVSKDREVRITMTAHEQMGNGESFVEKPTLEDFDAAALALVLAASTYSYESHLEAKTRKRT